MQATKGETVEDVIYRKHTAYGQIYAVIESNNAPRTPFRFQRRTLARQGDGSTRILIYVGDHLDFTARLAQYGQGWVLQSSDVDWKTGRAVPQTCHPSIEAFLDWYIQRPQFLKRFPLITHSEPVLEYA